MNQYKYDVFRCQSSEEASMLLYSTGSKSFNIKMRANAKRQGYLLNQHGLFKNGKMVPTHFEADFFNILGMQWLEPKDRL